MSLISKIYLSRLVRQSRIGMNVLRPARGFSLMQDWWQKGRPAPPPHAVKMSILLFWADRCNAQNLVETGSYYGDTIRYLHRRFENLYSIEIAKVFSEPLRKEFAKFPGVHIVEANSATAIPEIVDKIKNTSTVFWLDAHHSGGETEGFGYVPTESEVIAIASGMKVEHVIVIDDMKDFSGKDGYPTVEHVANLCRGKGYEVVIFNNMLQAWRGK